MVPTTSAATPPTRGLIRSTSATPIPGSATCEIASEARVMRRITAKQPTRPAATAIATGRASASGEMVAMHVEPVRGAIRFLQPLGSEHVFRGAEERRAVAGREAQDRVGVLVHQRELV